ncbi:MAG: Ig-like domain-containing protein [Candidatus Berkelbacteria bacterium]
MNLFLKKSIIYSLITTLAVPVCLLSGFLTAPKAMAADFSVLSETFDSASPASGWVLDNLGWYSTGGESSTKGLQFVPSGISGSATTSDFTLKGSSELSFWAKSNPYQGSMGDSVFTVSEWYQNGWNQITKIGGQSGENYSFTGAIYTVSLSQETTKVQFSYSKIQGNVSLDNVKISYIDNIAPTVDITNYQIGDIISGVADIDATAYDAGSGVQKVEFYYSNLVPTKIGEDTTAPYSISWDTVGVSNGPHSIYALVYDNAGNQSVLSNSTVPIFVDNSVVDTTAPVITLNGPDFEIINNTEYVELGAVVTDNVDATVTIDNPVVTTGAMLDQPVDEIDLTTSGIYLLTYSHQDVAGNVAIGQQRLVFVNMVNCAVDLQILGVIASDTTNQDLRSSLWNNNEELVNLLIQNGTEIIGDGWNKVFNLPTVATANGVTLPIQTGLQAIDTLYYEIGAGSTTLNLDIPAKITFPGKAGYKAGYIDNITKPFVPISDVCVIDPVLNYPVLADGGACVANVDNNADGVNEDLVIWTRHLTTFGAYNEQVIAPVATVTKVGDNSLKISWQSTGADSYTVTIDGKAYQFGSATGLIEQTFTDLSYARHTITVAANIAGYASTASTPYLYELSAPVVITGPVETPVVTNTNAISTKPAAAKAAEQSSSIASSQSSIAAADDTKAEDISWTPWIVLFIMILLAGAATGGYFWWFSGQDEDSNKDTKTVIKSAVATGTIAKKKPTVKKVEAKTVTKKNKTNRW